MSTVNFRMVRLGREMRGLSQSALARDSGVSQAVVSRVESGLRPTTPGELQALARALHLPEGFFTEPEMPGAAPLFRKRAIRSARVNRMIQARVNTAVLAARRILDAGLEIDAPFAFPAPGEIPRDDPLSASAEIRRAWRMPSGRVDHVTGLIEAAGGVVLQVDFGTDDATAAFLGSLGDSRLWFLVNSRETAGDRVRLSLAHELGHAVMHRYLPVHDESTLEPEAFAFALGLVLPPENFNQRVPRSLTLTRARDLKRTYWISIQAVIRAAHDRNLIPQQRYRSLYKQISARGWRLDEPDVVPIEAPGIWPEGLRVHRGDHGYTDTDIAGIARLHSEDLADLFPRDFTPRLRLVPSPTRPANDTRRPPAPRAPGERRRSA